MNLSVWNIVLLIVLALVLFGAKRLPEMGRAAGKAIREFKSALNGTGLSDTDSEETLTTTAKTEDKGDEHA
ncbi:MAG: twin-arginine translocase TatA/TatE family subunit [Treponema sp.]|nr:twin-arginine translocase TatA/TatE family subunit [Treponema sp.]